MILKCYSCEKRFDADTNPSACPFCGSACGFAQIRITDKRGNELSYTEHIESLRKIYLQHVPEEMNKEEIQSMSPSSLEDLHYFMSEQSFVFPTHENLKNPQ